MVQKLFHKNGSQKVPQKSQQKWDSEKLSTIMRLTKNPQKWDSSNKTHNNYPKRSFTKNETHKNYPQKWDSQKIHKNKTHKNYP